MFNQRIYNRIVRSRQRLILDYYYFGALAQRLQIVEAPHITDTAATDGISFFYNPYYIDQQPNPELLGLWAHETIHPALRHHVRRGTRAPRKWNYACDYAVNPILREAGLTLPQGALYDKRYIALSSEIIYDRMPDPAPKNGGGGSDSLKDLPGAVLDAPNKIEQGARWQTIVKETTMAARAAGKLPASVEIQAAEWARARTDWESILRRFVQQQAVSDYSLSRPNRRYISQGIIWPGLHATGLGEIVVVEDTSDSTRDVRKIFEANMVSVIEDCSPERTHALFVDAAVARAQTFERDEPVKFRPAGGGGTIFDPAFEWVDRQGITPACLIYLTDGYPNGDQWPKPVDYPVLWAMSTDVIAPWGETVRIEL